MAFTNDEAALKGINLDMIQQYYDSINQLKPLMLDQSGYTEKTRDLSFEDALKKAPKHVQDNYQEYNRLIEQSQGYMDNWNPTDPWGRMTINNENGTGVFTKDSLAAHIAKLKQDQQDLARGVNTSEKYLEKTPEAKALEDRFKALQDSQLSALEQQMAYLKTPEYQAQVDAQRKLEQQQQTIAQSQADRQMKALNGEIGVSDVLGSQLNESFAAFKEAEARNGNIVMGDSWDNATAKGTAANESLGRFQRTAKAQIQGERDAIIQGESPAYFQNMAVAGGNAYGGSQTGLGPLSGQAYQFATGGPGMPNYLSGSQGALGGMQPYQFDQQMQMQQQMLEFQKNQASKQYKSGLISGGAQLLGMGVGAASGPYGMFAGQQAGQAATA
jgi:hypothetical protein